MSDGVRESILHESDFVSILERRAGGFLRFLNLLLARDTADWVKRHYAELAVRAHEVETFLDDSNARNNKAFSFVTELVASLRGLGNAAVALKHLMSRFPRYTVSLGPELSGAFFAETDRTVRFLNQALLSLIRALTEELAARGVRIPEEARPDSSVPNEGVRQMLPHNIDEEDVVDEGRRIAEVATRYLAVSQELAWARRVHSRAELTTLVRSRVDEEHARTFQSLVHSVQSKYDTYIKATASEGRTAALPRLRGHVSLTLHLLECATELVHFYVRHENDIRYEPAKARIAALVDKGMVLDRVVNYAFHFAARVLEAGRPFAEEALATFLRVEQLEVTIPPERTLHARPISLIVKIVNHYGTHVELEIEGERCNAASIMEMILAVGNRPEARKLVFRGDALPLADMKLLFENGMGEDGLDCLPAALDYLRSSG